MVARADDVVVFLGPSLPVAEARRVLAARYLPPVRCGDILRVRRWKPRAIAIVDGLFERVAAVWHKEILLALEDGIAVYGASSMGALRAAELERFGMIGVGPIFEAYRDGVHTDDDEVTLVHGRGAEGHVALSDAMVNIRATLERAVRAGVIGEASAQRIAACAKSAFYKERSLDEAIARAWPGGEDEEAARLRRFLADGGFVDQKRLDALALLERLARERGAEAPTARESANKATYILWLQHHVMSDGFAAHAEDLPLEEKVAIEARTLEGRHARVQRLARLLAVAHGIARTHRLTGGDLDLLALAPAARTARWATAHDLDGEAHAAFLGRVRSAGALVAAFERKVGKRAAKRRYEARLVDVRRLDGRPASGRERAEDLALDLRAAKLWCAVEEAAGELHFAPHVDLQKASDEFRHARGLGDRAAMFAWMDANALDAEGYEAFLERTSTLEALSSGKNLSALGLRVLAEPVSWLLDALRLTDLYRPLRRAVLTRTA